MGARSTPTALPGSPIGVSAFALAQSDPSVPYAGVVFPDKGTYKSVDGGTTWTKVDEGANVAAIAVDPTDPDVVYAGGYEGLQKSTDGGTTWFDSSGGVIQNPSTIAIDPSRPQDVFVLSTNSLFRSLNGGAAGSVRARTGPSRGRPCPGSPRTACTCSPWPCRRTGPPCTWPRGAGGVYTLAV